MHKISSSPLCVRKEQVVHSITKRGLDILLSACALLLSLPLFFILYVLIKSTSKGPMLYCSLRIGREGKLFKFWKLRSMYCDADERLDSMLQTNSALKEEWQIYFKLKNDPRLTPIGQFLRSTSLDEIPQFWNVLKGDLSIVGPRPYLPREANTILKILGHNACKLFSVRPGLTGLWQIAGRNRLTFEERVKLEATYVDKRSFLFDMKLIIKTIPILLSCKGAF